MAVGTFGYTVRFFLPCDSPKIAVDLVNCRTFKPAMLKESRIFISLRKGETFSTFGLISSSDFFLQ